MERTGVEVLVGGDTRADAALSTETEAPVMQHESGAHLQFRAEVFNIFNQRNFALPNVTLNSGAFGSIASTPDVANGNPLLDGGPRQVQEALRMEF